MEEILEELKMNPLEEIFEIFKQFASGYRLQEQVNNLLSPQNLKFQSIQH